MIWNKNILGFFRECTIGEQSIFLTQKGYVCIHIALVFNKAFYLWLYF